MEVTAIPLTNFCHGNINAIEGQSIPMQDALARELERHGLVRIVIIPRLEKPKDGEPGKAADDGQGQLSSALPAAPVSPTTTLHVSRPGDGKPRKRGK